MFLLTFWILSSIVLAFSLQVTLSDDSNATLRVYNGREARPGEFPYMAYMVIKNMGLKYPCAGIIISPEYILTSGYCIRDLTENSVTPVFNGLSPWYATNAVKYPIAQKILHEGFSELNGPTKFPDKHNIGLIKLAKPIKLSDGFMPIKLADKAFSGKEQLTLASWGQTNDGKFSKALLYASFQALDNPSCRSFYPKEDYLQKHQNDIMCILPTGAPQLYFDISAPLIRRAGKPSDDVLIGFQSADMRSHAVIQGKPRALLVFVSVGYYRNWIKQKTGI